MDLKDFKKGCKYVYVGNDSGMFCKGGAYECLTVWAEDFPVFLRGNTCDHRIDEFLAKFFKPERET